MTIVYGSGESIFTGTELDISDTKHDSINVDSGVVHIDGDHSDGVIRIKHTRGDGQDILIATDVTTNTSTATIDSQGVVHAKDVYYHSTADNGINSLDDLDNTVEDNLGTIGAATAADAGQVDNLVKRSQANGTAINNLHVVARTSGYTTAYPPAGLYFTEGTCDDSLDLLGLGQLSYQPYDGSGNAIVSRSFSFGRAMPLAGQTRAQADAKRDGLLIEDDAVNHSTEIMCSNELPTIRLIGTTTGASAPSSRSRTGRARSGSPCSTTASWCRRGTRTPTPTPSTRGTLGPWLLATIPCTSGRAGSATTARRTSSRSTPSSTRSRPICRRRTYRAPPCHSRWIR